MSKQLWLRLNGSLEQGFEVAIDIRDHNQIHGIEAEGALPANPKLAQRLAEWRQSYHDLPGAKRIILDEVIVEMINPREVCLQKRDALEQCFKDWLLSSSFRAIERQIQAKVNPGDALRMVIRTQDKRLHHLPWHLWDLVEEDYKHAEVALATRAQPFERLRKPGETVKVLAIVGDSKGIDTELDCEQLKQLPNAEVTFLAERPRQDINDHLWDQDWDILFFAGHSRTEQTQGRIYINSKDSLTIKELKYGLERAIARGLQLAIFNSCDGLGLAYELEQLHIPQLIVMREPVPDRVAQEFLKRFLTAFADGASLYAAERYARERLQGLEGEFPCASWLPVIVQNPAVVPPAWADLWQLPPEPLPVPKTPTHFWQRLLTVMVTSAVVTGVVVGVRSLGWLQAWELKAYDQLMQLRPPEVVDKKFLLVTIDDADIAYQQEQGWKQRWSLTDAALKQVLEKLERYDSRVIGLDITRDAAVDSDQATLINRLKTNKRLYTICFIGSPGGKSDIKPPPEVPSDRLGFSNIVRDADGIVRRQILFVDIVPTSACPVPYALSTQLALQYLKKEGITPEFTATGDLKLGQVVFKSLEFPVAGYRRNELSGSQILLNYRPYRSFSDIADTVSLIDVLSDRVNSRVLEDRIVLIGVLTSTVSNDRFLTPYSNGQASYRELPGVMLHAQMASQIIQTVLHKRPVITVMPPWQEYLWVLLWSIAGSLFAWRLRSRFRVGVAMGMSLGVLFAVCFGFLIQGYWLPLIPAGLAMIVNGIAVLVYFSRIPVKFTSGKTTHGEI